MRGCSEDGLGKRDFLTEKREYFQEGEMKKKGWREREDCERLY
jgi:hypothetical protein